jgi:hypothetical protein|nr:hypothetical protein [Rhodoferax sp.]
MTNVGKARSVHSLRDMAVGTVCLATLGALCGGAVLAILVTPLMLIGLLPLILVLALLNPQARRENGWRGVSATIARGFVMLTPFTVLALVAHFWLHWNAAQVFTSSGLMAVGASTGMEMVKIGGSRIAGAVLPTVWFALLAIVWMLFSSLVAIAMTGA